MKEKMDYKINEQNLDLVLEDLIAYSAKNNGHRNINYLKIN